MGKKKIRRTFKPAFKREVAELYRKGDRGVTQLSRDLDISENSIRRWVAQYEVDIGEGPPEALTTAEREELKRLRREVRQLKEDREILKKAAAFFARESE